MSACHMRSFEVILIAKFVKVKDRRSPGILWSLSPSSIMEFNRSRKCPKCLQNQRSPLSFCGRTEHYIYAWGRLLAAELAGTLWASQSLTLISSWYWIYCLVVPPLTSAVVVTPSPVTLGRFKFIHWLKISELRNTVPYHLSSIAMVAWLHTSSLPQSKATLVLIRNRCYPGKLSTFDGQLSGWSAWVLRNLEHVSQVRIYHKLLY